MKNISNLLLGLLQRLERPIYDYNVIGIQCGFQFLVDDGYYYLMVLVHTLKHLRKHNPTLNGFSLMEVSKQNKIHSDVGPSPTNHVKSS